MRIHTYQIQSQTSICCFNAYLEQYLTTLSSKELVFLIDEKVFQNHPDCFSNYKYILIPSGESSKSFEMLMNILHQLISMHVDKHHWIVGVGGGVVGDLAGLVAGLYKRGTRLALVPTTILAMVDAAIGGKNGINAGGYKNMIGMIRQPDKIFFDLSLLQTLPHDEWRNGFAEIIKHAAILDLNMFQRLSDHDLNYWKTDTEALQFLIEQNVSLKMKIVAEDSNETGIRKWLNFGHSIGHAIEVNSKLSHGESVAIGMRYAAELSRKKTGFSDAQCNQLIGLLLKYELPTYYNISDEIWHAVLQDKKRKGDLIDFILLKEIGSASIQSLDIQQIISSFFNIIE